MFVLARQAFALFQHLKQLLKQFDFIALFANFIHGINPLLRVLSKRICSCLFDGIANRLLLARTMTY
jgi:hypothetical protein